MTHWKDKYIIDHWRRVLPEELKEMYQDSVKRGGYEQSYDLWLIEIITHGDFVIVNGEYYIEY